jgi:hypothetical protein
MEHPEQVFRSARGGEKASMMKKMPGSEREEGFDEVFGLSWLRIPWF